MARVTPRQSRHKGHARRGGSRRRAPNPTTFWGSPWLLTTCLGSLSLLAGCAGEVVVHAGAFGPGPAACEAHIDDLCVGVGTATGDLLGPCPCSDPVQTVNDASELHAALGTSGPGDCVFLQDGQYGHVDLPAGVGIEGATVAGVVLGGLTFAGGAEASACRLTVEGTVEVNGDGARLKYVHVTDQPSDGVTVAAGGEVTLEGSTISEATRYGILGTDSGSVTMIRSAVTGGAGPGIWMQCDGDCDCSGAPPRLTLDQVAVRGNALVGVALLGTRADLTTVQIANTTVGDNFEAGGGLSIARCSDVTATDLRVENNSDFGVLADNSDVTLGGPGSDEGVTINGNLRGIWLQNISSKASHTATIQNATLTGNQGIGIGMAGALGEKSIHISDVTIADTEGISLPNLVGGVSAGVICMADAVLWLNGVEAHLENVTTTGSGRIGVLIDGAATGSLQDVKLTGGDENGGIVQVNYTGGPQPDATGSTPDITVTEDEKPAGGFVGPDCAGQS